ncbi:extracellular solute-binding protein [Enterobacteriaceae endosymbiont of Plateumaris pusilla]|uniref:extracellular solute-binding protein n=1 Tax=Enterobacteriaceae endosymbiont of Plateumaris pusilla TaxID=2675795 RepID=UPI001449952C|nr:extracellular solute-binding protein [Enterobacteriaceae endosymbiont of Plateumaris pusilla]QJC29454.1 extracellular solute-binding protein [Enterobacteriaceae endosymbiont of Plateumaris pusilla]
MIFLIKLIFVFFILNLQNIYSYANTNNTIFFYNWTEYVPDGLLEEFTKETGIKVIYSTYESNESMYAKLKTYKKDSYDLIVPSTYFIAKMKNEGMLLKINKNKLTNFINLDPKFLNKSFDPNNDYSIPYIWGFTTIAINSNNINSNNINSWADLWNPKYKNSISLIDDAREVFQVALMKLGYSGNETNLNHIKEAFQELQKLIPNIITFNSDNPGIPFIEGEAKLGMIWNGSAYALKKLGIPLKIIWPKEGGIFWMDSFAIPSNAKNVEGALKLINFLLKARISAQVAEITGYSTPNLAAKKLLPKNIINDNTLYPNDQIIKKGEWQNDIGDNINKEYESYFQKLKNS